MVLYTLVKMDLILVLSLLLIALSSVEAQCAIKSSMIVLSGPSYFLDPTRYGFILRGLSQGGNPTASTWKRDSVDLTHLGSYRIVEPRLIGNANADCSLKMYESIITVTGRLPGVFTYHVNNAVTASDIVGTYTVEAADPPTDIVLRQISRNSVQISWTPPVPPPNRGYQLATDENINSGMISFDSTHIFKPVSVSDILNFRVVARTSHFNSAVIGPKSITVRDLLKPVIQQPVIVTTTSANIRWQLDELESLPAEKYTVIFTRTVTDQQLCPFYGSDNITTYTNSVIYDGLEEFTVYDVNVIAYALDLERLSDPITFTTLTAVPDAAPTNFTTSRITSTSITLIWLAIDCRGRNGDITSYDLLVIYSGNINGTLISRNINPSETTYTVGGLLPISEYRFHVAGVNVNGTGPYTAPIGIRTEEGVPGPVMGLVVGSASFYTLQLSWSAPQNPNGVLTGYDIKYTVNGTSSLTDKLNATSDPQTYTISNLKPQTNISNIIITARTQIGPGSSSLFTTTFITRTELPLVEDVAITVLSTTSANVSWSRQQISEITHYIIFYRPTMENQARKSISVKSTESSVTIDELITGAEYQFQVAAQVMIDGKIILGQKSSPLKSLLEPILTTTTAATIASNRFANTAVIFAISTFVAYSIILLLVLLLFYIRKKFHAKNRPAKLTRNDNLEKETEKDLEEELERSLEEKIENDLEEELERSLEEKMIENDLEEEIKKGLQHGELLIPKHSSQTLSTEAYL